MASFKVYKLRSVKSLFLLESAPQFLYPLPILLESDLYVPSGHDLSSFVAPFVSSLLSSHYPDLPILSFKLLVSKHDKFDTFTYVEPAAGDVVVKFLKCSFVDNRVVRFFLDDNSTLLSDEVFISEIKFSAPRPIVDPVLSAKFVDKSHLRCE